MLQTYRRLFAIPHLPSLLLWSLAARLHLPGVPIAVTFLVADWTGSYTAAGLVIGALTIGTALVGPLRGRMADRGAADRLMVVCGVAFAAGLLTIGLLPARLWWPALPVALVTGLFAPPANQVVRALWPRITTGRDRQAVFAADATLQELLFVLGPVLAAGAVTLAGPRAAFAVTASTALVGSLGLASALRRAGLAHPPADAQTRERTGTRRSLLRFSALPLLFAVLLFMIGGLVSVDLGIVAWANELAAPEYVIVLTAVFALGSLAGGLAAGSWRGVPRLARRAFATALGVALLVPLLPPVLEVPTPLLVAPVLFVSGLAIAPTLAAAMGRLSELAPPGRRAETFGWMATAMTVGSALASPFAGALMDIGGVAAGVAGAAVLVLAAATLALFVPAASRTRPGPDPDPAPR